MSYRELFLAPNARDLNKNQIKKNKRIPPARAVLRKLFGYDNNMRRLFKVSGTGSGIEYIPEDELFIKIDGIEYPQWRVKSMLLLGNPDGITKEQWELKGFKPVDKPNPYDELANDAKSLKLGKKETKSLKARMRSFVDNKKEMGFTQTSAYLPTERLAEFQLFIRRVTAEKYLDICNKLSVSDKARVTLSQRNQVDVPSHTDFSRMLEKYENYKSMKSMCVNGMKHLEEFAISNSAAKRSEDDQEYIKWASLAVAHSHMTSTIWAEIIHLSHSIIEVGGSNE